MVESDLEREFLTRFVGDYLSRFKSYPLSFHIEKNGYGLAGKTINTNLFKGRSGNLDLTDLLRRFGVGGDVSIGGDFVMGHDYQYLRRFGDLLINDVGVSIFDTANHGYDSLFLAGHVRSLLLNVIDHHLRNNWDVQPSLFEELNDMMRGPITTNLIKNTNPLRQRPLGAVGIHGQLHTLSGDFNFLCGGLPLFYYHAERDTFFYLEPDKGPPLGYFAQDDQIRKPYVPHSIRIRPGDYLFLASDGCFESDIADGFTKTTPRQPVRHFRFKDSSSLSSLNAFKPGKLSSGEVEAVDRCDDPVMVTFCGLLQPFVDERRPPRDLVAEILPGIVADPYFHEDDASIIAICAPL